MLSSLQAQAVVEPAAPAVSAGAAGGEAAARRELRRQIGELERRLSETVVTTFRQRAEAPPPAARASRARPVAPRVLTFADLEALRDDLAARVVTAQARLTEVGERQERARARLERMLREPGRHRFARVAAADLGEGGCGVWQVRPRLGLVGMLAGWWEVKLSSGCPRPA
jgi:hypothetical protein